MSNVPLAPALGLLVRLERQAFALAAEASPKLSARAAGFAGLLHEAFELTHGVPPGAPGLVAAQDLWLALERCGMCFMAYDPQHARDVQQLKDALEEARVLANVVRALLGAEAVP